MKFIMLFLLTFSSVFAQVPRKDFGDSDKRVILEVLTKNDDLFNAFLTKDGNKAEKISSDLYKFILKSDSKKLADLKKDAVKLLSVKAKNSHEANLAQYEIFLKPLVEIVKSYDVGNKYQVFYCPMVKKSWLQNVGIHKEVKNVYAMEMLECGTQETNF